MKTNYIKAVLSSISLCYIATVNAQTESVRPYDKTQGYVNVGVAIPTLYSGKELMRAKELRENSLSYFENTNGERAQVGNYPSNIGRQVSLGFYNPIKLLRGLMVGGNVTSSLTGSQPESGGYEEGYYFNYLSAGVGVKYYPFVTNNFYAKADAGLGSIFTKNRYLNTAKEQEFFHQFGIGQSYGAGAGYTFTPFKNKDNGIELSALYQFYNTRVEVNGIGDDRWQFGSLNLQIGFTF